VSIRTLSYLLGRLFTSAITIYKGCGGVFTTGLVQFGNTNYSILNRTMVDQLLEDQTDRLERFFIN
jgi:hypothetical protein